MIDFKLKFVDVFFDFLFDDVSHITTFCYLLNLLWSQICFKCLNSWLIFEVKTLWQIYLCHLRLILFQKHWVSLYKWAIFWDLFFFKFDQFSICHKIRQNIIWKPCFCVWIIISGPLIWKYLKRWFYQISHWLFSDSYILRFNEVCFESKHAISILWPSHRNLAWMSFWRFCFRLI